MPTEAEKISEAMSILGSRTSKRKAAAARRNGNAPKLKFKGNAHDRRKARRKAK